MLLWDTRNVLYYRLLFPTEHLKWSIGEVSTNVHSAHSFNVLCSNNAAAQVKPSQFLSLSFSLSRDTITRSGLFTVTKRTRRMRHGGESKSGWRGQRSRCTRFGNTRSVSLRPSLTPLPERNNPFYNGRVRQRVYTDNVCRL